MVQLIAKSEEMSLETLGILKLFRRDIHQNPELAGLEKNTAQKIQAFIEKYYPDEIISEIGGTGLAVIYRGVEPGPTVMIRADIDAVPIQEINSVWYRSKIKNVCHACGHDGHLTIVAGLAPVLHRNPIQRGQVVLLFQPAEETGEGAAWILASEKFQQIRPDYIFALHNLPQYPFAQVLVKPGVFSVASKGMIVKLKGATSHAAHPEDGKSPALALSEIIVQLTNLGNQKDLFQDFCLVTVVHARLGEVAFGTTPGEAEVMATLRSYLDQDMEVLSEVAIALVKKAAAKFDLDIEISWTEEFPATVNHPEAVNKIRQAALESGLNVTDVSTPFPWSEDFGHYTRQCVGAYFGLGAGQNYPQLHNCNYDFPDELIGYGIKIFAKLVDSILGSQNLNL